MVQRLAAVALGLATILGGHAVQADYVVYTNRASFESAITGETTESFNELGSPISIYGSAGLSEANGLTQPLTISGSSNFLLSSSASAMAGYYPTNGTYLLGPISTSATDGLTVTLPANTYSAAGADVAAFASNSVVSFLVTTSDGSSFTSSVAIDASSSNSALGFLGVVLTNPNDYVTSLTFSTPLGAAQNVVVDNTSFGFAPLSVPEPASMTLIAAGGLALGISAARRRVGHRPA
jgi:hypothetical protein